MYIQLFIPGPAYVREGILQAQAASQAIQAQFSPSVPLSSAFGKSGRLPGHAGAAGLSTKNSSL